MVQSNTILINSTKERTFRLVSIRVLYGIREGTDMFSPFDLKTQVYFKSFFLKDTSEQLVLREGCRAFYTCVAVLWKVDLSIFVLQMGLI